MVGTPQVSIIIPVYNAEKYLAETLGSLREQTLDELEMIFVDDCSTDASPALLRDFAAQEPRSRLVFRETNGGPAAARKTGMLASRGKFVMFMDNDDQLYPYSCRRALELMLANPCDILNFHHRILKNGVISDPPPTQTIPVAGALEGDLMTRCMRNLFDHTLWQKIMRGDLCRMAAGYMTDEGALGPLDDYYTFFVIAFFAERYFGAPEEKLYIYRERIGYCTDVSAVMRSVKTVRMCEAFLRERGALASHGERLNMVAGRIYQNCLDTLRFAANLDRGMMEEAARCWGAQILIDFMDRLGVFRVGTDDRNGLLVKLANAVLHGRH